LDSNFDSYPIFYTRGCFQNLNSWTFSHMTIMLSLPSYNFSFIFNQNSLKVSLLSEVIVMPPCRTYDDPQGWTSEKICVSVSNEKPWVNLSNSIEITLVRGALGVSHLEAV